jgi:hypothetical protein
MQQLIASLDRRYVTVRGIMMHAEGYDNKQAMAWRFLQVGLQHCWHRGTGHRYVPQSQQCMLGTLAPSSL